MTKENWKVVEQNHKYEVSDYGRVRNKKTGKILKPQISSRCKSGYFMVSLSNGRKDRKTYDIHRLVTRAFYGLRPKGKECCHNDGNGRNNKLNNLRYDTHKNNGADSSKHGVMPHGEKHNDAKLTEREVREIRLKYIPFQNGYCKLAKEYHVSSGAIGQVIRGDSWQSVR